MRKYLTFITLILLFLTFTPKQLKAQVTTGIGDYEMCYKALTAMPVVVQNVNAVDSLKLVLSFNSNVVEFIEYFAVNGSLSGGNFKVVNETDSIIITWVRPTSVTIAQDTLVWLRFKGLVGSTELVWNSTTSYYHTSGGNALALFDNGSVIVNPEIKVLLTEINPTCSNSCDANFMANASGGTPLYTYRWNGQPGRFDSIQTGLCAGRYLITVTDSKGCKLDSTFTVSGLPGAKVKLIIEGNEDTTIYLQNPVLTFSFQEISPTHVIEPPLWEFGDGDTAVSFNPTHVYSRANTVTGTNPSYHLILHIKNENGCDSLIEMDIPIKAVKITPITSVMTPNSDSFNDSFMILNQQKIGSGEEKKITAEFLRMELVVFDRWGRKIYDDSNYQNNWEAKGVPDGAYYYILRTIGFYNTDTYKGSITILGSGISN